MIPEKLSHHSSCFYKDKLTPLCPVCQELFAGFWVFIKNFSGFYHSKSDKGIVVVLVSRIIQKRYGQRFLAAIPDCPVEIVGSD